MMKSDFGFVLVDTEQIDEKRSQLIPTQTSESTMKDVAVTAGTGIKDVAVYLGPKVGAATVAAGTGIKDVAVYLGPKVGAATVAAGTGIKDVAVYLGPKVGAATVAAGTGIKDVAVYLGPKVGAATVAAGSGIKDVAVYLGPKIGVAGTAIKDTSLSFGEMVWDKMTQTFIWWNTPTPKAVEEIEMTTDITHKNPLFELTDSTVERLN